MSSPVGCYILIYKYIMVPIGPHKPVHTHSYVHTHTHSSAVLFQKQLP